MNQQPFGPGRRRAGFAVAAVASLALTALAAGTSYADGGVHAGDAQAQPVPSAKLKPSGERALTDPEVDVTARAERAGAGSPASTRSGAARSDGIVLDLSPTTGTVRFLADLDGYLTPRSAKPAPRDRPGLRAGARRGARARPADLRTFHLTRDYRDITGTHHLYFTQRLDGTTLARHGLTASVSGGGHLLTVGGAPVSKASDTRLPPASAFTIASAAEALAETRGPEDAGAETSDDTAQRVLFETGDGLRPAWETVVTSSTTPAVTVIDAVTGRVLLRSPMTHYEHSTGRAFRFFPGARAAEDVRSTSTSRARTG